MCGAGLLAWPKSVSGQSSLVEPFGDELRYLVAVRLEHHGVAVAVDTPILQSQMLDGRTCLSEEIDDAMVVGGHPRGLGGDDDDRHTREVGQLAGRFLLDQARRSAAARTTA